MVAHVIYPALRPRRLRRILRREQYQTRAAGSKVGVNRVQRRGPFHKKSAIIFRRNLLFLWLFAQFDFVQVTNLCRGILRCIVKQPNRRKHRLAVRKSAAENQIQTGLLGIIVAIRCAMPRICRRHPHQRLALPIWSVTNGIVEAPRCVHRSSADFLNRETHPVPRVVCTDGWHARRHAHQHTQFANHHRSRCDPPGLLDTLRTALYAIRKIAPDVRICHVEIVARGILHRIPRCPRCAPANADRVNRSLFPEIDHDPLRQRIQVWIALPECALVPVGDARIPVVISLVQRIAASRKTVAVRHINRIARRGVRYPITLLAPAVAPSAARIPMPHLAGQLRPQSVRQWLQPSRQHGGNIRRAEQSSGVTLFMSINRRA